MLSLTIECDRLLANLLIEEYIQRPKRRNWMAHAFSKSWSIRWHRTISSPCHLAQGEHLHGRTLLCGVKEDEFDCFHDLLMLQELARLVDEPVVRQSLPNAYSCARQVKRGWKISLPNEQHEL